MVRAIMYFLFASVVLGTILTPGLAAFALVAVPFVGLWFVWRIALAVVTGGRSTDAVVRIRRNHFLGPGGPDDSFADEAREEDEYSRTTETAPKPSVSRNGAGRRINLPRPAPAGPLPVAAQVFAAEREARAARRYDQRAL